MEGALGQRNKQMPVKSRQQTELGSKPGVGNGRVCKAAWETSKCRVTTCTIKKKKKNTAHRRDRLQREGSGARGTQDRLVAG